MQLVRLHFKAFSQGADINANIKLGWCAGVTALVSEAAGSYVPIEGGDDNAQQWTLNAFKRIELELDMINNKTKLVEVLQAHLRKRGAAKNVCDEIHKAEFNGRECKIILSNHSWVPLFGYISYAWRREWVVNHIGYLVRADKYMLIFDPNYGFGLFEITDRQPLTLNDLTNAIMGLARAKSAAHYYLSYTAATAVVDEDAMGLRLSLEIDEAARELRETKYYTPAEDQVPQDPAPD